METAEGDAANFNNQVEIRNKLELLSLEIENLRELLLVPKKPKIYREELDDTLIALDGIQTDLRNTVGQLERIEHAIESNIKLLNSRIDMAYRELGLAIGNENYPNDSKQGLGTGLENGDKNYTSEDFSIEDQNFHLAFNQYKKGFYLDAADSLAKFITDFPYSDRIVEAFYWLAECQYLSNNWEDAATAYLNSFSGAPLGKYSVKSLFGLGVSLGKLEKKEQACLTLREINLRYPGQTDVSNTKIDEALKLLICYE